MKLELKTENENYSKSFSQFFKAIFSIVLIIIFCDVALKLGVISRHYQLYYNCRLLLVGKSQSNFKKLSRLFNIESKQKIWELCREFVK